MLEALFGNRTAERVLLYLQNYERGYATEIANTYEIPLNAVQKQLQKLEESGLIVSQLVGRTRVYTWNPRSPFVRPVRNLLAESLKYVPEKDIKAFYRKRQRPRRTGKPL